MRKSFIAGLACVLLVLPACGDSGGTSTAASTSDATASGTTTGGTDATGTSAPTTGEMCPDPTEAGPANTMEKFGAPCEEDADCVTILGDGGVCFKDVLMLYGLPGGYCTKACELPDLMTKYVEDDAICGQGVTCLGVEGYLEVCAVECTDDSQCPREGYECRTLPQIGMDCEPRFCLMTDENML